MAEKTVVCFSGGMDSSLCLTLAMQKYGRENVSALTYDWGQKQRAEIDAAQEIAAAWQVAHKIVELSCLREMTASALFYDSREPFSHETGEPANTMVVGRNGLFARLAAIYADHIDASSIYLGILGLEVANSGYRDCSRAYMDLKEKILQIDLANPYFAIHTPLVEMTKEQTIGLAERLGILDFLLEKTVSCYAGIKGEGCKQCPACLLRNEGLRNFYLARSHRSGQQKR